MTEAFEHLSKEIINLNGKVFLGFVHPIYGPLRNLNFILKVSNLIDLDSYLTQSNKPIITSIWTHTMLATQIMVLPWEMTYTTEVKPQTFESLPEAEAYIIKKLSDNEKKAKEDSFYYRLGIE